MLSSLRCFQGWRQPESPKYCAVLWEGSFQLDNKGLQPLDSMDDSGEGRSNRTRFLVLGTVIILALGYMIYAAFPDNALYFLTVSEFNQKADVQDGRLVRVTGKLVDGTFDRPERSTLSHFQLTDKDGEVPSSVLSASYTGVLPDLFFNPHSEIILEGSVGEEQIFQADNILVKCPSKYQSLEEEEGAASS